MGLNWGFIGSVIKDVISSSGGGSGSGYIPKPNIVTTTMPAQDDILRDLKDSDTLMGQVLQLKEDVSNEAKELLTDGFYHMVIKGETDYKTSFDYRDEAEKIVSDSMNEYITRCGRFNKYIDRFNSTVNSLYERKRNLLKTIDKEIWAYKPAQHIYAMPESPHYEYTPSTKMQLSRLFGLDVDGRKQSGMEYLNSAQDYQLSLKGKCAELNRIESVLETVKVSLEEEDRILDVLEQSLHLYKEEPLNEIRYCLNTLLTQYVITENGKINTLYEQALNTLKQIEQ